MPSPLCALLLAAVPLAAQPPYDSPFAMPEQFPGQLASLRLAMLYPAPLPEPARGLEGFLEESEPVLRDVEGLIAYLRAGLGDPRAVDGDREHWREAWTRLDAELARLAPLIAEGEELERGPVPRLKRRPRGRRGYVRLEDAAEFPDADGARLHRAAVLAAYARNLREHLIRRASGT